jgi:hypothetical protein
MHTWYANTGNIEHWQKLEQNELIYVSVTCEYSQIANLEQNLNVKQLTSVQELSIPTLLNESDALIRSQTGSGKTLAYAIPIIEKLHRIRPKLSRKDGLKALIILPTRELAIQTYEWFVKLVKVFYFLVVTLYWSDSVMYRYPPNFFSLTRGLYLGCWLVVKNVNRKKPDCEKGSQSWSVLQADYWTILNIPRVSSSKVWSGWLSTKLIDFWNWVMRETLLGLILVTFFFCKEVLCLLYAQFSFLFSFLFVALLKPLVKMDQIIKPYYFLLLWPEKSRD